MPGFFLMRISYLKSRCCKPHWCSGVQILPWALEACPKIRVNLTLRLFLAVPRAEFQVSIPRCISWIQLCNTGQKCKQWCHSVSDMGFSWEQTSHQFSPTRYMGQPWLPQARFGTGLWFRNTWKSKCWLTLYLTLFRSCLGLSPLPPHIFACVNLLHCYIGENHCSGLFSDLFLSKLFLFLKDTPDLRKLWIYTRIWHA